MATQTLPCLYIPDDSANRPAEEKTLVFPPSSTFDDVVCALLQCQLRDAEIIYSEDELEKFKGRENGLPPGKRFIMYEAYMDDNGNATRPVNSLAERLLVRPKSHGPMIVVKLSCTKSRTGEVQLVQYHHLTQSELASSAFQNKRRDYSRKYEVHHQQMLQMYRAMGVVVLDLH